MKVVIVTYNWPPRNAIGTHRPYAWARYWSDAGAEVTVLTAKKQMFDAPLDLNLPDLANVAVIEIPYANMTGLASKVLISDRLRHLARKMKLWLRLHGRLTVDPRNAWFKAAIPTASRLAMESDVVVSTYGPATAHLIANEMKLVNPKLRWVADYRDLWSLSHLTNLTEAERCRVRRTELDSVGKRADLITVVSKDMVKKINEMTGIPALCIPNGFDVDENILQTRLTTEKKAPAKPFRIVHTGMLYEGHRDPTPLLDALISLKKAGQITEDDVTVDFYGTKVDLALRLSQVSSCAPFIRIMGHVPREEALAAQQSAGLLLLLESPSPEARGVLTGKLFEYISAGRPIICIGSRPEYEIGQVLSRTKTGQVFGPDEYKDIQLKVLQTLGGQGLFAEYSPELEEILRYSRKRTANEMLEIMSKWF